jgi:queuine tRNA-ribosyltransferase
MHEVVEMIGRLVDHIRPVYLHAIGGIAAIWNGLKTGFDTFNCVCPTRLTCHGRALCALFLHGEKEFINVNNSGSFEGVFPIDSTRDCHCCRHFSCLYIYPLFKAREMLGGQLLAIGTARFVIRLMKTTRQSIGDETF